MAAVAAEGEGVMRWHRMYFQRRGQLVDDPECRCRACWSWSDRACETPRRKPTEIRVIDCVVADTGEG